MARTDNRALWTADRRLYLDKAGKVVEADNPDRQTLLVAEGGQIPTERAQALGLTGGQEQALGAAQDAPAPEGERKPGPNNPETAYAYLEGEGGQEQAPEEGQKDPQKKAPANKARQASEDK